MFLSFERSGKKNKINTEITGSKVPITNHLTPGRPIRFANAAVANGILNRIIIARVIKSANPIIFSRVRVFCTCQNLLFAHRHHNPFH